MRHFEKSFKIRTLKTRHAIVKKLAPKLYADMVEMATLIYAVPRPMTTYMKQNLTDKPLTGAEIGTARGDNALNLLQELPLRKLYLIDPYIPYMEHGRQPNYSG